VNKEFIFVGIDASLTSTGVVVINNEGKIVEKKTVSTKSDMEIEKRFIHIRKGIEFIPRIVKLKMVYMEGPSFSSNVIASSFRTFSVSVNTDISLLRYNCLSVVQKSIALCNVVRVVV